MGWPNAAWLADGGHVDCSDSSHTPPASEVLGAIPVLDRLAMAHANDLSSRTWTPG